MKFVKMTNIGHIIVAITLLLILSTPSALKIKDINYCDDSQYLVVKIDNPDDSVDANISIIGYLNNNIDTRAEIYKYTLPKNFSCIVRKKMVFKNTGEHEIFIEIHTKNATYTSSKNISINYAYDNSVPIHEDTISDKIDIDGIYFKKYSQYPMPFYDFIYVVVKNNDIIPHYITVLTTASSNGNYIFVDNNKIMNTTPPNGLIIKSWSPKIYLPPKSKKLIPIKINFKYAGDYKLNIDAIDDEGNRDSEIYDNIHIECPLNIYDISCQEGSDNFCYSNWFDINVNNTVDYDVYGTLNVFLCRKEGDNYTILDNKTVTKYFLSKDLDGGYSLPVKLNTSLLNYYDDSFTVFVIYNTGSISSSYQKTFSKPIKINGLNVENYPDNYYFLDRNIYYDVEVNITNNLNKYIYANVSIKDMYNKTYSKEVKLPPKKYEPYTAIRFEGLKIKPQDLSHAGNIKLKFEITATTPTEERYYISRKNETKYISLNPASPVYISDYLNRDTFVGYPENISISLKKTVGRTVYARVYITTPNVLNNSAHFEEKYIKIDTMEDVPVNIESLFLKEYDGPAYIHVDTYMGVRESSSTMIVHAKPIIYCTDAYLNNYSVYIKISSRTMGYVTNEPIVGHPSNLTVSLKSYIPSVKNIEIWAMGMDENGNLIKCSEKKKIDIHDNYKKTNLEVLFNDSLEGYLVICAKTGDAIIPIHYEPIMATYPINFNLSYDMSNPWANLTLYHNYPVPLDVVAKIGKYPKKIKVYPCKKSTVKFWAGENRTNLTVSIDLLNNISTIKHFNKTFYFKLEKELNDIQLQDNVHNIDNKSKQQNEIESVSKPEVDKTEIRNSEYAEKNPKFIQSDEGSKHDISVLVRDIKNLITLILAGFGLLFVVLLMYEPTRSKILSTIVFIMYKLNINTKNTECRKKSVIPKPPQIYMQNTIFSLGDTVSIKIISESDIKEGDLYITSATGNKYNLNIFKSDDSEYHGEFIIPKDESQGQYFIVYKHTETPLSMFIVVKIK